MCGATFGLAGCGGGSISTDAGAKALREAGFRHMVIHRHTEIATELSGEIDEVDVGPHPKTRDRGRAELIDFQRRKSVWRAFKPPYAPSTISISRICNVIFWSYNPHNDPRLAARAQRAARLLRAQC
jgi:hypothetical protein